MDLVEFFGLLSGGGGWKENGKLVVVSGNTCIRMDGRLPSRDARNLRHMALNEQDDLERPPDSAYKAQIFWGLVLIAVPPEPRLSAATCG
jgi:hypothetical protein